MAIEVTLTPVRSDNKLLYSIVDDVITVTYTDNSQEVPEVYEEVFDFTNLPDGEANIEEFEFDMPFNPFVSAKKVDGELKVTVIDFVGKNASEDEKTIRTSYGTEFGGVE